MTDPVTTLITSGDAGGEVSEIIAAADRKVGLSARRTVAPSVTVGHYRQPENTVDGVSVTRSIDQ